MRRLERQTQCRGAPAVACFMVAGKLMARDATCQSPGTMHVDEFDGLSCVGYGSCWARAIITTLDFVRGKGVKKETAKKPRWLGLMGCY